MSIGARFSIPNNNAAVHQTAHLARVLPLHQSIRTPAAVVGARHSPHVAPHVVSSVEFY